MARHGLSRPSGAVQRREPPHHDRWQSARFTGRLRLALTIPEGQFVSPATGRLTLASRGSGEVVAQEVARAAGTPVIPGSGIKGAVRTLYELLSFSCDPFAGRGQRGDRCSAEWCCDACSLFGVLGRSGRAGFDDARPSEPPSVRVEVREVPMPWEPQKPQGEIGLYDLDAAKKYDRARKVYVPAPRELSREVLLGTFETRLTFWNLSREELGRLLLCMGMGVDASTRFWLRLGGVKYDGKGAVAVRPLEVELATPARRNLSEKDCEREVATWLESARTSEWGGTFWPLLLEVAQLLGSAARGNAP